eukprot:1159945-Prorocentrum_minimum.AAC.2
MFYDDINARLAVATTRQVHWRLRQPTSDMKQCSFWGSRAPLLAPQASQGRPRPSLPKRVHSEHYKSNQELHQFKD